MRFRQLELVRYGGFEDRVFDFGEGCPDLHLVVGPNEAGKSTALQAIGDFLFGIPSQSNQNWRYDYGQLRLRALIEHEGELLDVTRRKGNRDTLLKVDGTPFAEDPLARLLGGIDRAGSERMFGLDHAKLRQGGESILGGRDDAARITLQAGTGVSHIGKELSRLTDAASELFKPGGQNPPVNRLMRERSEALAQVRQASISDAEWTQSRQRRTQVEERRVALIEELSGIAATRVRLADEAASIEQALAELRGEDSDLARERADLEGELKRLAHEAGLPGDADETVVADALEALGQVNEDTGSRDSLQRQVSGIEQDRTAFEVELTEVLALVGIAREGEAIDQTRQLAASLRNAVRSEEALATHIIERNRLTVELDRIQRRLGNVRGSIEEMIQLAGVASETDLDQIIATVGRRDAARTIERDALGELAGTDNGAGLDALALGIASLSIEEEAAARARIADRRREVAAEREVVGRTLNAADDEAGRAASESAAADAQQAATDTTAALAQAAEDHIQAVTAAALLRWMLDRHRATNQAPLIARAGALFKQVTGGAFTGLTLGYANEIDRSFWLAAPAAAKSAWKRSAKAPATNFT